MGRAPNMRLFHLSPGAVSCDRSGLYVGSIALLEKEQGGGWRPRPLEALNRQLSDCYGLPIDVVAKTGGLVCVARALRRQDIALAQIASLHLQFPDPPNLAKGQPGSSERDALALALYQSGLLKQWDGARHPRTGTPPNPGRFATVPKQEKPPAERRPGWPVREVNQELRDIILTGFWRGVGIVMDADFIVAFIAAYSIDELNTGEQRLNDQWKANLDPPKTLEEIQQPPAKNLLGYELHHKVEQNPSNIAKEQGKGAETINKFGREIIDSPDNLVWVPRLRHEQISNFYNERDENDPLGRRRRDVVNRMTFEEQQKFGLMVLRKFGVLK
jgi:hypothetical protein